MAPLQNLDELLGLRMLQEAFMVNVCTMALGSSLSTSFAAASMHHLMCVVLEALSEGQSCPRQADSASDAAYVQLQSRNRGKHHICKSHWDSPQGNMLDLHK